MQIGAQYYRPPFPARKRWEDDMKKMADSGLTSVQLWVLWSWVEAAPGVFVYDDYDRLAELAAKNNLNLVLSAIAELQPHWIHRIVPGSEMITRWGLKVVSTNRAECHFGITPGGCTDHPEVCGRMKTFFEKTVTRYRALPNLFGWDAWNELRWNVHAQDLVCYCPHTLRAFRTWLERKYGSLDKLNAAWQRRYCAWEDVEPGRSHHRPFTEMMAFQEFIMLRADRIALDRYNYIKSLDPERPVTVHAAQPCPYMAGWDSETPVNRGNDWNFADKLDGVGTSSFPNWFAADWSDFAVRMETIRSAAGERRLWLSELQGGRASQGFTVQKPVAAADQQRWLFNGLAVGAEAILFWCWRDEVFTTEAGGFGIVGADGHAEQRVAALQKTRRFIDNNAELLAAYRPRRPEAGVLFSPQTYFLHWCIEGGAHTAANALQGYAKALVKAGIPCEIVEEEHIEALDGLKILFMPRTLVVTDKLAAALKKFVKRGGTLVLESECGAFDTNGIYLYPEERFLASLAGVRETGRRLPAEPMSLAVKAGGAKFTLKYSQWLTPIIVKGADVWAAHDDGALVAEKKAGKGRVIMIGTYLGEAALKGVSPGFQRFLEYLVNRAGAAPCVRVAPRKGQLPAYARAGEAVGKNVVFVMCQEKAGAITIRFDAGPGPGAVMRDALGGGKYRLNDNRAITFRAPAGRLLVLVEE